MIIARKYRIYPTKEQIDIIEKTSDCNRFVWNWALGLLKTSRTIQKFKKTIEENKLNEDFIKNELLFLIPKKEKNNYKDKPLIEIIDFFKESKFEQQKLLYYFAKDPTINNLKNIANNLDIPFDNYISFGDISKKLPLLKEKNIFLKDVNAQSVVATLKNLEKSLKGFFKKQNKYPRFKFKEDFCSIINQQNSDIKISNYEKYSNLKNKNNLTNQEIKELELLKKDKNKSKPQNRIDVNPNNTKQGYLTVLKIKDIPIFLHRPLGGSIKTVTITKSKTNKYYASILVEDGLPPKPKRNINKDNIIGLDEGLREDNLLVDSNGKRIKNKKILEVKKQRLNVLSKRLTRARDKNPNWKESKRYQKLNLKHAKLHEDISSIRNDFNHKITYDLTNDKQVGAYATQDINIKGMMQNRRLGSSFADVALGDLKEKLKYKCERVGITYIEIDRFKPTSKTCHICKHVNSKKTIGSKQKFVCENCKSELDRDINAAIIVKEEAIKDYKIV